MTVLEVLERLLIIVDKSLPVYIPGMSYEACDCCGPSPTDVEATSIIVDTHTVYIQ